MRILFIMTLLSMAFLSPAHGADKPLVVFANPTERGDVFFQPVTDFMQAAADDLGFELKVYYSERQHSHVLYDEAIRKIFSQPRKPDYILGMNPRGSGESLLQQAEANNVKVAFFNQGFLGEAAIKAGGPREKYANWIFQLLPDDTNSGFVLATTLAKAAQDKGLTTKKGMVNMIALNGHKHSTASTLRQTGLDEAVSESGNIWLQQLINADWKKDKAYKLTRGLMERYPDTVAIWAASDLMAEGGLKAIRAMNLTPGKDVLLGGIDWTKKGIQLVENGDLAVTVGGHFMEGGWALVMLYDSMHGVDVPKSSTSHFSVITADNVGEYQSLFGDGDWSKIDFRRFSKHHNPSVTEYDFGLDGVLRQFR